MQGIMPATIIASDVAWGLRPAGKHMPLLPPQMSVSWLAKLKQMDTIPENCRKYDRAMDSRVPSWGFWRPINNKKQGISSCICFNFKLNDKKAVFNNHILVDP
jgi:hypothetical protein